MFFDGFLVGRIVLVPARDRGCPRTGFRWVPVCMAKPE
jgi:hypothetical protein